ncbi:hypothetical protein C1752_07871 [Acaryochloris thomasi RCC1774]|uniref:ADP-ribose pyrophosphatase n=1 Tax=Acaryochloris thomasi RCC1774 TaxID=1764569 RepID=A0A2W1JAI4_9CYAN|nr:DUF5335 family protein [Acaryochloris thomasi]PZD71143.1 hypothetical protein C1752_07871 [Acaryochloris thomasi RCC1774]
MSKQTIQETQQIPQEQWSTFFDQFTKTNSERILSLEVADKEMGDEPLIKQSPLASITYEPENKGNDVMIAIGHDALAYSHTVTEPNAVWVAKDDAGEVVALEIIDHSGNQTILRFS